MGDVGSTFLGFIYAAILFRSNSLHQFAEIFSSLHSSLLRCFFLQVENAHKRKKYIQASQFHLYQRLHQAGLSHADVSLIYLSATLILSSSLFLFNIYVSYSLAFAVIGLGLYLEKNIAAKF